MSQVLPDREFFENPAERKYFIKILISSFGGWPRLHRFLFLSLIGKFFPQLAEVLGEFVAPEYALVFCNKRDIKDKDARLSTFNDKVEVGETLEQGLRRALRDDLGITKINYWFITDRVEGDYDKQGNFLPRYVLQVVVERPERVREPFKGLNTFWVRKRELWRPEADRLVKPVNVWKDKDFR
ncbi:hypothetical protein COT70_01895 [candidate division WWE3 bacterium CG09_land_8_20_14_0_10_47_33]|uniref:Nudix hydrolase domain-containing protein n=1 Tax=candidate division WWE3 bacterium CG_4_9_14_0_2_um_filter_48_10 TaxID=1975078 RepID=A0A2M8EKE6_UNCKA|nr:MAG: hypothetical protein COT70_01895 [candidate division WWE3 bacterium CG09_land_8_20_14_0_10_47_33]PIZ40503.1 MAG: hypothetical protein COY35_02155 [candidate division WWE3 bacterium CG_4_10_14_0_2_um_filter_47_8]PJC23180.1 MAG: hypothetical protein CO059_00275 [candidate division WWE3 bacterium CG_4_9_14_0_2_um_filter_48_10]PJE51674.1 MAG: hypothetical protein COV28_02025 [candidate division WWE3 bacterium CG10_big_fil_rev_8_21_14_0_10_48_23]